MTYVQYIPEAERETYSIRDLSFEGSLDDAGNVTPGSNIIRSFEGKLHSELIRGRRVLRLTMELPWVAGNPVVSLVDRYDLGNNFSLVSARKYKESKKHNYSVDITYPQIEPAKGRFAEEFNRKILSDMNKKFLDYIRYHEKFPLEDSNTAEQERTRYGRLFLTSIGNLSGLHPILSASCFVHSPMDLGQCIQSALLQLSITTGKQRSRSLFGIFFGEIRIS